MSQNKYSHDAGANLTKPVTNTDQIYDYAARADCEIKDSKAFAVRIRGDSMSPEFPEGSIAVLSPSSQPKTGDLVVARVVDRGILFMRLQQQRGAFRFIPANPAHAPIEATEGQIDWCYPVDQMIRKMR